MKLLRPYRGPIQILGLLTGSATLRVRRWKPWTRKIHVRERKRVLRKNPMALMTGLLGLLLWAGCDGGGGDPPESCSNYPEQTVSRGMSITLAICFTDPQGGELALTASSADPAVATAMMSGDNLTIAAQMPGATTVTVTATNTEGQSAETMIAVVVPNSPPVATGIPVPPVFQILDTSMEKNLEAYAEDPDSTEITWTASSENEDILFASVRNNVLITDASSAGMTTLTLTAHDATEGMLDFTLPVEVFDRSDWSFIDMMSSRSAWEPANDASLIRSDNGELLLSANESGWIAGARQNLSIQSEDWTFEAMVMSSGETANPGIVLESSSSRYTVWMLIVGYDAFDEADYRLIAFDEQEENWVGIATGLSNDWARERYVRIGFSMEGGLFWIRLGMEILQVQVPGMEWDEVNFVGVLSWPAILNQPAGESHFDWVRMRGIGQTGVRGDTPRSDPIRWKIGG